MRLPLGCLDFMPPGAGFGFGAPKTGHFTLSGATEGGRKKWLSQAVHDLSLGLFDCFWPFWELSRFNAYRVPSSRTKANGRK